MFSLLHYVLIIMINELYMLEYMKDVVHLQDKVLNISILYMCVCHTSFIK